MKNNLISTTDWTGYYSKDRSKFSIFTQKITLRRLLHYINKYANKSADVMELGGGNSCFAETIMKQNKIQIKSYSIIDNCELAVSKFKNMSIVGSAYCTDLTSDESTEIGKYYDIVYSVGLIEHFQGHTIEKIIQNHFALCKVGGIVIISVPTPTVQYRVTRYIMERLGVWYFPDESPLRYDEIEGTIIKCGGIILDKTVNYQLPLTQLIVVVKKVLH